MISRINLFTRYLVILFILTIPVTEQSYADVDDNATEDESIPAYRQIPNVINSLEGETYWLFEYSWFMDINLEKFRKQSKPTPAKETTLPIGADTEAGGFDMRMDIYDALDPDKDLVQRFYSRSSSGFSGTRRNIIDYVDPIHLDKDLAWQYAMLLGIYGSFQKIISLYEKTPIDNDKVLNCYKASFLMLSYYFGLSESNPAILQYEDIKSIFSNPAQNAELDEKFQNEASRMDEEAWVNAMQKLDQTNQEYLCYLFREFYGYFLYHREALPKYYISLAAHLNSAAIKTMLPAQNNPSLDIDAINPWMFKFYVDLKFWEELEQHDASIRALNLQALFPEIKKRCLKLMPFATTLNDITGENEFSICERVRMRNLYASLTDDTQKGERIVDEFEFSPIAMRRSFIYIQYYFQEKATHLQGHRFAVKEYSRSVNQIYNYLSGYIEMSDLSITEENALEYLLEIKLFDSLIEVWNSHYHVDYEYFGGIHFGFWGSNTYYFPRTTYELRKYILKLCPYLKSYEALTISVNPDKIREEKEQATQGAWLKEYEAARQNYIDELHSNAQYLSGTMEQSILKGVIVGARGISGAGKSTFLKKIILPMMLPEGSKDAQTIEALANGILNPDIIKAAIKKLQGDTLNVQIHEEGYSAYEKVFNAISKQGSYILDRRLLTPYDIEVSLVEPAKNLNHSVWLFDIDIPLSTSLTRILARPVHGIESCPEYSALIDGYRSAKHYRAQVIALADKENAIAKYELYASTKQILVAHKAYDGICSSSTGSANNICIHDLALFEQCLEEANEQTIEQEVLKVIDDAFITNAITNGDIKAEERQLLEQWRGITLKEAVQQHVQGLKGLNVEELFECPVIEPFNGQEWLKDYPQLIEFVQCEHLLHLRGVDASGRGLHEDGYKIDWGLNPKYNPEAKAPGCTQVGIQMKLGYFIVPIDNLDILLSEHLSPAIIREEVVYNEEGKREGLRFFVHPEAYAHFASLIKAGIHFVAPSESDYIGTPLSNYDTWLVRRIDANERIPFIVKMGTPNGRGDIKHLLVGDNIVRSMWYQKQLDKLPPQPDLILFKEVSSFMLTGIAGYPIGMIDSGIIISEIPEPLLDGECKMISLAALISCERKLPMIYEIMKHSNAKEFLKTYLIDAYLRAMEPLAKDGFYIQPMPENLYLVFNSDHSIRGFAYRDLQNVSQNPNLNEAYAVIFSKLLNVLTRSEIDDLSAPGRNLYPYIRSKLEELGDYSAIDTLNNFSITEEDALDLQRQLMEP